MTTRNDYPLGILNGRRGIVTAIDPDVGSLTATVGVWVCRLVAVTVASSRAFSSAPVIFCS